METSTGGAGAGLRGARALVLASFTLLTSVFAHLAGGGRAPDAVAVLGLLAALTLVTAPLLGRPASGRRILLLLLGGQALLHVVLSTVATAPMSGMAADAHGSLWSGGPFPGLDPVTSALVPTTGGHLLMAEAHLAATLVLGLWLAAGERALWAVLTMSVRPLATALAVLLSPAPAGYVGDVGDPHPAPRVGDQPAIRLWAAACRAVTRRGPPSSGLHALVA